MPVYNRQAAESQDFADARGFDDFARTVKGFDAGIDLDGTRMDFARQQFDKPSVLKRLAKEHAVYVQQLRREED